MVFVDGFQLASGLQHKAGRNLAAAAGGYQLFQLWNRTNIGTLVNQASNMDGQFTTILIVCLVAEQIKKLRVCLLYTSRCV